MCMGPGERRIMDVGLLGLLAVFMCPMVFGGITFYYSHEAIHQETLDRWKRQGYDYEKDRYID